MDGFLKLSSENFISGEELLLGGGTGGFLHIEEKLTLAPVIQGCANFPRMRQLCHESPWPSICRAKWKHKKFGLFCC